MSSRRNRTDRDFEIVVPTRAGKDVVNSDRTIDGHIRIEKYEEIGTNIYVDLFVSKVKSADKAHITSESFPWSDDGAAEVTRMLQDNGFRVIVMIK